MRVTPQWSLVTVTHNSSAKLADYWSRGVGDQAEWIVVDNASTDESPAIASELGAHVVSLSRNLGFAAANNVGFRASHGDYVAFVNPDVRIDPAGLAVLGERLEDHDRLLSPQLVNTDRSPQPNGRGWPVLLDQVRNRLNPDSVRHRYHIYASSDDHLKPVVWLTGAVVAGRRETFARLGPWNEDYFLYYEDVELGLRARSQGIESALVGDVSWEHGWARETAGSFRLRPWIRNMRSLLRFYGSHPALVVKGPSRAGGGGG